MRSVIRATCTSGDPVSPLWVADSVITVFFLSGVTAISTPKGKQVQGRIISIVARHIKEKLGGHDPACSTLPGARRVWEEAWNASPCDARGGPRSSQSLP